jgi:cell division protein FtsA
MGLLLEGVAQRQRGMKAQSPRSFGQVLSRMRAWFTRNF